MDPSSDKDASTALLPSWYKASGADTDLMVLDFTPVALPAFRNLNRKEICECAQEKCQELFKSLTGAIRFRDIRILVPDSTASDPIIMVRTLSCLISLDMVRALLMYDRMLLFVPNGADELIRLAKWKMEELSKGVWDSEVVFQPSIDEAEALAMEEEEVSLADNDEDVRHSKDDESVNNGVFAHFPFAASSLRSIPPKIVAQLSTVSAHPLAQLEPGNVYVAPSETKLSRSSSTASNDMKLPHEGENSDDEKPSIEDFSIIALEAVLWTAVTILDREQNALKPRTAQVIHKARKEHSESALEKLRQARKQVTRLLSSAERQVLALVNLTKNDKDMSLLSFKNIIKNPNKYREDRPESEWVHDHQDVEMLLENYIQRFDSVINDIRWLIEQTELAESSIAIDLDVARNRLLRMNITITAITAFSGIGAFVSGIFGMNLNNGMQTTEDPPIFWIVAGTLFFSFIAAVFAVLICSRRL